MNKEEVACNLVKILIETSPSLIWEEKRGKILEQYKYFYQELSKAENEQDKLITWCLDKGMECEENE